MYSVVQCTRMSGSSYEYGMKTAEQHQCEKIKNEGYFLLWITEKK